MNIIETHGLSRRFLRSEALSGLDLSLPAGKVAALLGPNGAGKTTTIKLLMNLLTPSTGDAWVLGVDSRRLGPAQFAQIGYVSENQHLPLWMSVRELLDYCRPFYPAWDRDLEKALVEKFDLPPDRKLRELSRGMLMKAALLSSMAYRPKLLVLDEPFSGLDPLVRDEFVRGVLEVSLSGEWTVLVSSHDIEEVERLADHVILLDRGRLNLSEPAESLQFRFRRVEAQLTGNSPPPLDGALEWERSGGLLKFIETGYSGEATERQWSERFPGAVVTAHPMTLREIFLTFARASRAQARGAAA
jgi:ABC-2 type transport system ATP-binding protein